MEKIEELIEAYETVVEVANDYLKHCNDGKVEAEKQMAIKIIENLDELKSSLPKPVEVPEFVGEYIEKCKRADSGLIWSIRPDRDANDNSAKVYDWLFPNGAVLPNGEYPKPFEPDNLVRPDKVNQIVFARAWLDGYTVIKEPRKHVLKLNSEYYDDVVSGFKKFEIRFNDRDYKVGDILVLEEYDGIDYTGDRCKRIVTYITDYAQQDGYVVLGIVPWEESQ